MGRKLESHLARLTRLKSMKHGEHRQFLVRRLLTSLLRNSTPVEEQLLWVTLLQPPGQEYLLTLCTKSAVKDKNTESDLLVSEEDKAFQFSLRKCNSNNATLLLCIIYIELTFTLFIERVYKMQNCGKSFAIL